MCIAYIGKAVTTKSHSSEYLTIQNQAKPASPTPERRRVRFSEEPPQVVCTVQPSSLQTDEEKQRVYWQTQDYDNFRATARIIASEVLKISFTQPPKTHSYDVVLTKVHQACGSASSTWNEDGCGDCSDTNTIHTADTTSSSCTSHDTVQTDTVAIPPTLFTALSHWMKAGHSRRGLEKFCVPYHIKVRSAERLEITNIILMTQDLLKDMRIHHSNEKVFKVKNHAISLLLPDDEILRMVSERFTRPSVRYAITMGHADAAAIGKYPLEGISLSKSSSSSSLSC